MVDVKFYTVDTLPASLSSADDGIYFVKGRTSIVFKYYVVSNGRAYEIDAITVDKLNQALSVKFDKPNGTQFQYIKGDGTYGLMNKEAVGLGNVDNTSDLNKPISTATQNALNNKADDSLVVHIDGYEVINGEKTFTKAVVSPTYPTDDSHLTNKAYVDSLINSVITDNSNFIKKNEPNNVTKDFTLRHDFSTPLINMHSVLIDIEVNEEDEGFLGVGVNDSNAEGVRMIFTNKGINVRNAEGDEKSMVTDGKKITFSQHATGKTSNDVAQMKDLIDRLETLKQWVTDNFLSLNGGVVNGDIVANKFFEKE